MFVWKCCHDQYGLSVLVPIAVNRINNDAEINVIVHTWHKIRTVRTVIFQLKSSGRKRNKLLVYNNSTIATLNNAKLLSTRLI